MKKQLKKFFIILSSLILIGVVSFYIFWLLILPNFIKSDTTLKLAQKLVIENLKMDLKIKNPTLKTYLRPKIDFKTDEFLLLKNNEKLVELKNFNISLSFYKILFKEIKLDNLSAKTLVVKADRLIEEFNKLEKKEAEIKPSDIKFDYFSAPIALENFNLSYLYNGALLDLSSKNIFINNKKGYNTLNFDLDINLYNKNKKYLTVKAVSDDDIKLFNDKLQVEDFIVKINNSKIKLNSWPWSM